MFPAGGGYKAPSPKETAEVDEDILEYLRLLYPDAPEEALDQAARCNDQDEALDRLQNLMNADSGSPANKTDDREAHFLQLKMLKEFFTPEDGSLSKLDNNDIEGLLAGFHGDASACCGIAMAEPQLIDMMLKEGLTIEMASRKDAEEQERLRKEEEARLDAVRIKNKEAQLELEKRQRECYVPASISEDEWTRIGQYLLELATPATRQPGWTGELDQAEVPRVWTGTHGVVRVEPGEEFTAVAGYLAHTLEYSPEIRGIMRVQNYQDFYLFRSDKDNTMMFHGCRRGSGGEQSIAMQGFQIKECQSKWHGKGDGTWLAYRANYSDRGFVFADERGLRHIFVCIASKVQVLLNDQIMRVVGQGCAIPLWIVTYCRPGEFKEKK